MHALPPPPHFDPSRVGEVWRVPYEDRAREAPAWAEKHGLGPAAEDAFRLCLLAVDVQNTFCIPDFELFVAGRSGTGAVDDNRRLCEFVYRNLGTITQIFPSLDTHHAMQVFHAIWLVDEHGDHPAPYTLVSAEDVETGRWRMNPAVAEALGIDVDYAERHLAHYTRRLAEGGKYDLTIWPYHAMLRWHRARPRLGGRGGGLLPRHRPAQPARLPGQGRQPAHRALFDARAGGDRGTGRRPPRWKNTELIEKLLTFDAVVVAGQAKSHCMAWTIDDLLEDEAAGERLAERTYLLEDCTSPVVVPGVVDYTDEADAAFERYAAAGMHVVRSTDPIESWPGLAERASA